MAELTEDEVLQILDLIEKSSFDFLELQMGDLKLTVSKGGYGGNSPDRPEIGVSAEPASSDRSVAKIKEAETGTKVGQPMAKPADVSVPEGALPITAPMLGTFYITPEPGAPPFIKVGGVVDEDTPEGRIEVMKVCNACRCGGRCFVTEICVQSGQFGEYWQTLFMVSQEGGAVEKGQSK